MNETQIKQLIENFLIASGSTSAAVYANRFLDVLYTNNLEIVNKDVEQ